MTAQPNSVSKNASVDFSTITLRGEVLYYAEQNALMLLD
jgi:hypothetical protein